MRRDATLIATPLFLVLVMIEFTDLVFAVDSIPAILAIMQEPFIIYTSNVFAFLGLRALYFALAGIVPRFIYLKYALSLILVVVGGKMIANYFYGGKFIPTEFALLITAVLIGGSIALSLLAMRPNKRDPSPCNVRRQSITTRAAVAARDEQPARALRSGNLEITNMKGKDIAAAFLVTTLTLGSLSAQAADIVDTAVNAGQFKTLAAALRAADLVNTLKGTGPFTVFAPTDEAFGKLPAGTVESLLLPENKAQLVKILTYHVVPGRVMSTELAGKMTDAKTVQGQTVKIDGTKMGVTVGPANVLTADVRADNGVIHVIDKVILPN